MRISDWSSDVCSSDLEPIELLPAIEHQLQRSDAQREHREAECVEPDAIGILRLTQKQRQPEKGKHAHGQVDVEHPAPRSEEHTSELQSLMRISYAVFCFTKQTTTTSHYKHKIDRYT